MYVRKVVLTGSARRRARAEMRPEAFTRAQACGMIAGSDNPEVVSNFLEHQNQHVKRAAAHKLAVLEQRAEMRRKRSEAAKKAAATRRKNRERQEQEAA